jgi:hypothetical protein
MSPKNSFIKGSNVQEKTVPIKKKPVVKRFAPESPKPTKTGRPYLILILIIAMGLSAAYLIIKGVNVTDNSIEDNTTPQAVLDERELQEQDENTIDKVKRHIIVNENEAPYVATISNIDLVRARNPVFYKDASQGDKVLIWSDKAVIYSESLDKLVAVTTTIPPELTGTTSTQDLMDGDFEEGPDEAAVDELEEVSIEIRNGSRVLGAASKLRTQLTKEELNVERIGDAANSYEGTKIIDLTGGKAVSSIQKIVEATEGTVSVEMPEGEPETGSDILIIIGL